MGCLVQIQNSLPNEEKRLVSITVVAVSPIRTVSIKDLWHIAHILSVSRVNSVPEDRPQSLMDGELRAEQKGISGLV
jgi:hypothetical protein